jgi:hypothetical protein
MHRRTALGKSVLVLVAIVAVAIVSITVLESQPPQTGSSTTTTLTCPSAGNTACTAPPPGPVPPASNASTSVSTVHSATGLQLTLDEYSVTHEGKTSDSVNVSLYNTRTVQLTLAPGQLNFGLGPCSQLPFGVAIFMGRYDSSNLSSATPMELYQPGAYNCPAEFGVAAWSFAPMSSNLTLVSAQPASSGNATTSQDVLTQRATASIPLTGFWSGGTFHRFSAGTYTAAADDEWGDLLMVSFNLPPPPVANSSGIGFVTTSPESARLAGDGGTVMAHPGFHHPFLSSPSTSAPSLATISGSASTSARDVLKFTMQHLSANLPPTIALDGKTSP